MSEREIGVTLQDITELRKFGNTILAYSSVGSVFEETFLKLKERLSCQIVSIFLFSKDGFLERYEICGVGENGIAIEDSWLSSEKYEPGESFSGIAAYGTPYGEPYWSNNLDDEIGKLKYGQDYIERLGFLSCGISVPLNGTRRTFGTIEVINRLNPDTGKPDSRLTYSESDICWLTIVGAHVAAAISRLRKKDEDKIFATISRVLADPELEELPVHTTEESVYKLIANNLVDYLMPYKACIVRLTFDGKSLFVTDKSHSDGDEIGWNYRIDEPRFIGEKIVGKVFQSGKHEIVENISKREGEFTNIQWIRDQNLKSFVCFPLKILGKVIGTISLFTGYVHEFSDSDLEFLENVSFLLAAFRVRSRRIKDIEIPRDTSTADEMESRYYGEAGSGIVGNGQESTVVGTPMSAEELELLISEAVEAGVPEDELIELREHLQDVRNGLLADQMQMETIFFREVEDHQKLTQHSGREIIVSTAPGADDDFDGVVFKEIRKEKSSDSSENDSDSGSA